MSKKQILILGLAAYFLTATSAFGLMTQQKNIGIDISQEDLGKACVAAVFPNILKGTEKVESAENPQEGIAPEADTAESETASQTEILDTQDKNNPMPATPNLDTGKPLVIIYHTHSTESYQPYSEGNFHVLSEEGTVREVGKVMASELESLGIGVIHDTTIHDSPSYNESYTRSMETLTSLMNQYPGAVYVIDLHRDAASYNRNRPNTVIVNGETAATYSLVIGQGNANVNALTTFANAINARSGELYPGFQGKIIEKSYRFNQYVSDYYLLLEVGNNENNIKEAKITGKYFAHVLADIINEAVQQ